MIGLTLALLAALGLYGLFPYFQGYETARISIAQWLWHVWTTQEAWQHGLLVPFLAAWLVWRKRETWRAIEPDPAPSGFLILLAAMFTFWLGYAADVEYFGSLSLWLFIAGLLLWFRGRATFHALLFPWLFLIFLFPMLFLDNLVAFPLRMIMARSADAILHALHIASHRSGTALSGPGFAIDVADPCSGIRSLFALLMISALYGTLALPRVGPRWLLFLAAIPLAIAGNIARLLILVAGTRAGLDLGTADSPSAFHLAAGYAVFAVALGGMTLLASLLNRLSGGSKTTRS